MFIPDYIINRLTDIDVISLAERLGINVIRHRRALCFMHEDHNPSLTFYPKTNSWYCWVCDKGGSTIDLVSNFYNLDFQHSCIWLANAYGISIPNSKDVRIPKVNVPKPKRYSSKKQKVLTPPDQDIYNWVMSVSGLHDFAKDFLFNERKYTEEAVNSTNIKSIQNTEKFISSLLKKFGEEKCLASKLLWKNHCGWKCCFDAPCLLFPFYGLDGKIYHIQSRYMGNEKKGRFNGPTGESTLMFNLPILKTMSSFDNLYISEGVTDCLAFLSEGKKAVALPGAHSYKEWFGSILKDFTLFMYVDDDKTGRDLLSTMNKSLARYGTSVNNIRFDHLYHDYSERHIALT